MGNDNGKGKGKARDNSDHKGRVSGAILSSEIAAKPGREHHTDRASQPGIGSRASMCAGVTGIVAILSSAALPAHALPSMPALDPEVRTIAAVPNATIPPYTHAGDSSPHTVSPSGSSATERLEYAQLTDLLFDLLPPELIPNLEFLGQMQELVRTVDDRQGQYALLTAAALAHDDPDLVNGLATLESSVLGRVEFDGNPIGDVAAQLGATVAERNAAVEAIALQARQEAATTPAIDFTQRPDLRGPGPLTVTTQTLSLSAMAESGPVPDSAVAETGAQQNPEAALNPEAQLDLYVPGQPEDWLTETASPRPVIIISHGAGGQRQHFSEIASHLASYGFVVVVPDHDTPAAADTPSSSWTALGQRLFGVMNPIAFVQRPLTITAILDQLEQLNRSNPLIQGRLDLEQVGVVGHSLGGYTALALASDKVNRRQLRRTCGNEERLAVNLSLVLQCQASVLPRRLPSFHDPRVKAVLALNPVTSAVLGESQLEDIEVPVMMVTGSHDAIAPMVSEQLPAFSWLTTTDKYLVTLVPGGHISAHTYQPTRASNPLAPIISGPSRQQGGRAIQALSVAFMKTHLSSESSVSSVESGVESDLAPDVASDYLTADYGQFLSQNGLSLHLITEWDE